MASTEAPSSDLGNLVGGTVSDIEKLIGQHFDMLGNELKGELEKIGGAAASLGAGAGAATLGGVMGGLMLVHLLHDLTRLPLWVCYGLVGGALGAAGAGLLYGGAKTVADVDLVPRRTAETVREELSDAGRALGGRRA